MFAEIKAHRKARVTDTPVNAEALLPDGPYDLWREGEASRFASQLAGAFARYPHLPKVLRPKLVTETVLTGVRDGLFVARCPRPDGSFRTWWREDVDSVAAVDAALEIVLPEKARLARLNEESLAPGQLPDLWEFANDSGHTLSVATLLKYFAGGHVATIPKEGYEEYASIPACPRDTVLEAVHRAIEHGIIWMTNPPATSWKEPVPAGALSNKATLHPPPPAVTPQNLTKEAVPAAWQDDRTNGLALTQALSQKRSTALPWGIVRDGIGAAVNSRWLVLVEGSGPYDCEYGQAAQVILKRPPAQPPSPARGGRVHQATLDASQIQDLADEVPDLLAAAGGSELRFHVGVTLEGDVTVQARSEVDAVLARVSSELKSG